jgi:hypothetical protein
VRRFWGPIALLLLTAGFFWKLILTDQYVWFDHPDMVSIELPRLQFQVREIQKRHFPLWDPNIWLGQPLVGQTQPGPLFPLNLLFALLPMKDGYLRFDCLNAYYVFVHFLAAWFCYLLCRDLRLGEAPSVFAGCAYSFGGFLGTAPWLDVFNGAIWTPLVAMYLLRAVRGEGRGASAARSGLFLGVAWLSGHHELPILVSMGAAGLWLWHCLRDRALVKYAVFSLATGAMVSAVQVWPTVEFGRLSERWVGTARPVGWNDHVPYTPHTAYSLPARGVIETFVPHYATYADVSPFVGVMTVALALLGLTVKWGDRTVRLLAGSVLLSLAYAMGAFTPLQGVIYSLSTSVSKARMPVRALHLFDFILAVAAAYGLESLLRAECARWLRRFAWIWGAFGALLLAGLGHRWIGGMEGQDRLWLAALAGCGVAVLFLMVRQRQIRQGALTPAVFGLMLTELTLLGPAKFPHVREGNQLKFARAFLENRDIAEALRREEGPVRIAVNDNDIPENFGDWHAIEMMQGYVAGVPKNLMRLGLHEKRVQELVGMTHAVSKTPYWAGSIPLFSGASGVNVYRTEFDGRPRMPHAWAVHELLGVNEWSEVDAMINDPGFDFRRKAAMLGPAPALESCGGEDTVRIIRHGTDRVTIESEMRCRGLVILSDAHYPGWRLKVDGKPGEIIEVYGALRGVVVDGGKHTLDMIYRPVSILAGGVITLAGLAIGLLAGRFS